MSELLQTGQHPDADQLSAFVEHVLPAHEQEWMLAHLAVCPDCRSVVAVSMPPVEELPGVRPVAVRRPWFSGWNLVWPVAVAFAALILIVVLVRKGGGNAPPTQIAEEHLPENPAAAPAQAGPPVARSASPSPTGQDRAIGALQPAKPAAGKALAEPTVENESLRDLPLAGRNPQALPPSAAAAQTRVVTGMAMGNGSGLGSGQGAQAPGNSVDLKQQLSVSAGVPAPAPPTAYAMAGPTAAPVPAPPVPPAPPPPVAIARAANGLAAAGGASTSTAVRGQALDALSDDATALKTGANTSSTAISGASLAGLAPRENVVLHPVPSGLPVLSVATAGQRMLALDSGNGLFLSGDAGAHWKQVRAKWHGRAVKVALAVTPGGPMQQTVVVNGPAFRGGLQGRMSAATEAAASAPAAGDGATLTGQVTDPSGAVIPGAAVTVTNAATAAAVTVKTDAAGRYFAGGLAAGGYRVDATARGFARQELNVTLAASQQAKADLKLQVGQMSETVTVTDATPLLDTENATVSAQVLQSKTKKSAAPMFAITTDTGERWVSADGRSWKRE